MRHSVMASTSGSTGLFYSPVHVTATTAVAQHRRRIMYAASKLALVGTVGLAALAFIAVSSISAEARPAWFGPGSGPVSPYANFKGFAQVPRQAGGAPRYYPRQPVSNVYRCVPNVGLVGANGVCPD
jgi:hypothetical protein